MSALAAVLDVMHVTVADPFGWVRVGYLTAQRTR